MNQASASYVHSNNINNTNIALYESFVTSLFIGLLDRAPDKSGHQFWVNALTSGKMNQEQVAQSFLESGEYRARSSDSLLPITETIQTLFSNAFDRPVEEQGLNYWASRVTSQNSLANVVCQILSVASNLQNQDGQRLGNAIDAVAQSMQAPTTTNSASGYVTLGELDSVTSDKATVTVYKYLVNTPPGGPATSSAPTKYDNVINGNNIADRTLEGTKLNDLIIFGKETVIAYGRDGDDLFQGNDANNYFYPGNGNDIVEAGAGWDWIDARSDAPATLDKFYGQDGNDIIYGGAGAEFIDGGDGIDFINPGTGNDVVRGGIGDDQIVKTGSGTFNLLGEAGDDKIQVANGDDGQINGGLGNDRIEVSGLTGGVAIYAMSGDDIVTLENVTRGSYVFLGDGNNQFTGSNISNLDITASSGNDAITLSNAKNVTVDLGNGNNTIELINCENVSVITGSGIDRFTVKNSSNITLKSGERSDYFNIDAASFKTGTIKLDGGPMPFDSGIRNWLTIDALATGDRLVFNNDSFSNFSDLTFDHSVKAKLVFEPQYEFGLPYPSLAYGVGKNIPPGATLKIHNINSLDIARLQSEMWFMQGKMPFNNLPMNLGAFREGDWAVSSWGTNSLTFNNGFTAITGRLDFMDVTAEIQNPYVFNGNLMLSWII